ncbi:MAG: 30S ribosomal protein S15 [Gammaproteobacteria bacterium]
MSISKEQKQKTVEQMGGQPNDTGSSEVQVALLTLRIQDLQEHFKQHIHDHHSRRGLIGMVSKRRKLLKYLRRKDEAKYLAVIKKLKLRR